MNPYSIGRYGAAAVAAAFLAGLLVESVTAHGLLPEAFAWPVIGLMAATALASMVAALAALAWLHRKGKRAIDVMIEQVEQATDEHYEGRAQPNAAELVPLARKLNVMMERFASLLRDREARLHTLNETVDRDELTDVASRTALLRHLAEQLSALAPPAPGSADGLALVLVRVSDLAGQNARHGRNRVDDLLRSVGAIIRLRMARWREEGAIAGRLNGADFALILPHANLPRLEPVIEDLCSAAQRLHSEGQSDAPRPMLIGCTFARSGEQVGHLLARADGALALCEHSRDPYAILETGAEHASWSAGRWLQEMNAALAGNRIGMSPRCRWQHAGEPVTALDFWIESNAGERLTASLVSAHAIRCSCADEIDLRQIQLALVTLKMTPGQACVSISAHSVRRPTFPARLDILLGEYDDVRSRLWIEIASLPGQDALDDAIALAQKVRPMGVRVGVSAEHMGWINLCRAAEASLDFLRFDFASRSREVARLKTGGLSILRAIEDLARRHDAVLVVETSPEEGAVLAHEGLCCAVATGCGEEITDTPPARPVDLSEPISRPTAAEAPRRPERNPAMMAAVTAGLAIVLALVSGIDSARAAPAEALVEAPVAAPHDSVAAPGTAVGFGEDRQQAVRMAASGTLPPAPAASGGVPSKASQTDTATSPIDPHESALTLRHFLDGSKRISLAGLTPVAEVPYAVGISQSVAATLVNNREAQAAEEGVAGARWDRVGAWMQFLPNASLNVDAGRERSSPASINDAFGNRVLTSLHSRKDKTVALELPILDLTLVEALNNARDREKLAGFDRHDKREGLAFDTASSYLSLLQDRLLVELAAQHIGYLNDLNERMRARVEAGGATRSDLDRIRGRSDSADSARIESLGALQTDLADFQRLTGVMPTELLIPDALFPDVPPAPAAALTLAMEHNPTYRSAITQIALAGDDQRKAYAGLLPRLSLQYTNGSTYDAGGAAHGNPVDGVWPLQRTRTVMLVAQWNVGASSVATGLSAGAKQRETVLRSLDARDRISQGITTGYATVNAAHKRYDVLRQNIEADERVVHSFEEQFAEGSRSLFELLDAYEQLYNARASFVRVCIVEAKANYQIHRQIGDLVDSIISLEGK